MPNSKTQMEGEKKRCTEYLIQKNIHLWDWDSGLGLFRGH